MKVFRDVIIDFFCFLCLARVLMNFTLSSVDFSTYFNVEPKVFLYILFLGIMLSFFINLSLSIIRYCLERLFKKFNI